MKLKVVDDASETKRWYAEGLRFTCSQCGNCCTGAPGFVWLSDVEVTRLAEHLKLTVRETLETYCRKVGGRVSLKEVRGAGGLFDCVFLKDEKVMGSDGVAHTKCVCSVYPARPLQCRTWPFWESNLSDPAVWNHSAKRCRGMNRGRKFSADEMEALRDATDWPKQPPSSGEVDS